MLRTDCVNENGNCAVTEKQYGGVHTAPDICREIPPTKTFSEDKWFEQGKNNVFTVIFFSITLPRQLTDISVQSNGGKPLGSDCQAQCLLTVHVS